MKDESNYSQQPREISNKAQRPTYWVLYLNKKFPYWITFAPTTLYFPVYTSGDYSMEVHLNSSSDLICSGPTVFKLVPSSNEPSLFSMV